MEETAAIMGGSFQIRSFDKGNNVSLWNMAFMSI